MGWEKSGHAGPSKRPPFGRCWYTLLRQDWKEMVHDPEVNAIVVGSPTPFHAEQIMEAAKLGKHIFCEKVSIDSPE